jgi:hypothetical protein
MTRERRMRRRVRRPGCVTDNVVILADWKEKLELHEETADDFDRPQRPTSFNISQDDDEMPF